jgi:hypothetical protein
MITVDTLKILLGQVQLRAKDLATVQKEYNNLHQPECVSCPGGPEYYAARTRLMKQHLEFQVALGLLIKTLEFMSKFRLKALKAAAAEGKVSGAEFVPGERQIRPHCEPWTVNGTKTPDRNTCGVICRSEPSCVGFAIDPKNKWCLWFDDVRPQTRDICSSQVMTQYVKKYQAHANNDLWTSMQKIRVFDKAIMEALKLAEYHSEETSNGFVDWWGYDGKNKTVRLALRGDFEKKDKDYTGTLLDLNTVRKQWLTLQWQASQFASEEVLTNPPFPPEPVSRQKAEEVLNPGGFAAPREKVPHVLNWADFPNSQDSAWSQQHPDCPMGVPCFCDCKCRGAPPQNFIEPPPLPPTPCPLPPIPNPAMYTQALR